MNLKYIMLSKDATDWMIPFIFHAGESTTFETENRATIAKLWHWRNEQTAEEYRKKNGNNGPVLYFNNGIGYRTICTCQNSQICTLK